MTNRERYKRAAALIQPTFEQDILAYVEARTMKKNRKPVKALVSVCAAVVLVITFTVGAYAADLGGFRKTVKVWLYGDMTEVTITEISEGNFELTYPDGSVRSAGGMAEDGHGGIRGVTAEEIIERMLDDPEVDWDEETGEVWLYLRDHKVDITEQINEQGWAQVKLQDGLLADYITVVKHGEGGYGLSSDHFGFPSVEELRKSTMVF